MLSETFYAKNERPRMLRWLPIDDPNFWVLLKTVSFLKKFLLLHRSFFHQGIFPRFVQFSIFKRPILSESCIKNLHIQILFLCNTLDPPFSFKQINLVRVRLIQKRLSGERHTYLFMKISTSFDKTSSTLTRSGRNVQIGNQRLTICFSQLRTTWFFAQRSDMNRS